MSLRKAAEEFLALIDHKREDLNEQNIDVGGGYSPEQYDDAVAKIRKALDKERGPK